ncbi:MAG: hypothetical protein ACUVRM_03395, partial [Bacillota bacterium]
ICRCFSWFLPGLVHGFRYLPFSPNRIFPLFWRVYDEDENTSLGERARLKFVDAENSLWLTTLGHGRGEPVGRKRLMTGKSGGDARPVGMASEGAGRRLTSTL